MSTAKRRVEEEAEEGERGAERTRGEAEDASDLPMCVLSDSDDEFGGGGRGGGMSGGLASDRGGEEGSVIGLTERGQLFINGQLVLSNCSSFAVHKAFLLFTTHRYVCMCVCVCVCVCVLPSVCMH